jgi:hypothetical protein
MIITLPLSGFKELEAAGRRKPGYAAAAATAGRILGAPGHENIQLTQQQFDALRDSYAIEPPLQPALATLVNAGAALLKLGKAIIAAQPLMRSAADQAKCMDICRQCEFWRPSDGRCSKCNCYGQFKSKLATEHCPVKKW